MAYAHAMKGRKLCSCGRYAPLGKRKCNRCISTKRMKVEVLRPSRKGANAVYTAAHKPSKSYVRKPKRQNTAMLGMKPNDLQALNMRRWV